MHKFFLCVVLFSSALMWAQNGAQAVAAKALKADPVACGNDYKPGTSCHANYASGCALQQGKVNLSYHPKFDAYLNYFKNQVPTVLPKSQGILTRSDFVAKYTAAAKATPTITKSNHRLVSSQMLALGEGQYFTVIGYLYYEQLASSGESSNCDIPHDDPSDDYHIGIGFSADEAKQMQQASTDAAKELKKNTIIVEMTPHYRAKYHRGTWTQAALHKAVGHQVKVVGQLLLDNDHMGADAVCSASNASASCWRLSPWELHPVTEFYVCNTDSCGQNSTGWTPLDKF